MEQTEIQQGSSLWAQRVWQTGPVYANPADRDELDLSRSQFLWIFLHLEAGSSWDKILLNLGSFENNTKL